MECRAPKRQIYLKASDVADILQLNVEKVYDLIADEGLPATKVGGQWRFEEFEIREWFKSRSTPSVQQLVSALDAVGEAITLDRGRRPGGSPLPWPSAQGKRIYGAYRLRG